MIRKTKEDQAQTSTAKTIKIPHRLDSHVLFACCWFDRTIRRTVQDNVDVDGRNPPNNTEWRPNTVTNIFTKWLSSKIPRAISRSIPENPSLSFYHHLTKVTTLLLLLVKEMGTKHPSNSVHKI